MTSRIRSWMISSFPPSVRRNHSGSGPRARIIADAEEQARKEIEAARATVASEQEAARKALRAEVRRLSLEAARRITGREYSEAEHAGIVDRILEEEDR